MKVEKDEDEGRTVGVQVAEEEAGPDISHDVLNGGEGDLRMGGVMHRKQDSGDQLQGEEEADERAVASVVGKVRRSRIVAHMVR